MYEFAAAPVSVGHRRLSFTDRPVATLKLSEWLYNDATLLLGEPVVERRMFHWLHGTPPPVEESPGNTGTGTLTMCHVTCNRCKGHLMYHQSLLYHCIVFSNCSGRFHDLHMPFTLRNRRNLNNKINAVR